MSHKRIKVLIGISLSIVLAFILLFISTNYAYYSAGEIEEYNNVFVATTYTDKQDVVVSSANTGIYGPFYAQYHVSEVDPNTVTTVYNTLKMTDLEPATTYNVTMRFDFESLQTDGVSNINVGAINYTPEELYDEETKKSYSNITDAQLDTETTTTTSPVDSVADINEVTSEESEIVNNFTSFQAVDGNNTYSVEMTFQTNENGEVWFVVAFDSIGYEKIEYRISNIVIEITEAV